MGYSADILGPYEPKVAPGCVPLEVNKTAISEDGVSRESGDKIYKLSRGALILDGAGGLGEGQDFVASRVGGSAIARHFEKNCPDVENLDRSALRRGDVAEVVNQMLDAFRAGQRALKKAEAEGAMNEGADTTANMTIVMRNAAGELIRISLNVGDSATFDRDDKTGALVKISTEHSLVASLVQAGLISPEEAQTHPQRNIVYKLLGDLNPNLSNGELASGLGLRIEPMLEGHSVVMFTDGVVDNVLSEHLLQVSKRLARQGDSSATFVHSAVEIARNIAVRQVVPHAKSDDISGVSIAPRLTQKK